MQVFQAIVSLTLTLIDLGLALET